MAEEPVHPGAEQHDAHPDTTTTTTHEVITSDLASPAPEPQASSSSAPTTAPAPSNSSPQSAAPLSISTEIPALGPATDSPIVIPGSSAAGAGAGSANTVGGAISPAAASGSNTATGPHLGISLMLTTGARHPYRIDEKYLRSRKIAATGPDGGFDPRELSGYQLKELIWIDWRAEWEPRPASPSSIRLIIMGRMLEDKTALKDYPFTLEGPNVVHMTVKPADLVDDEETGGKGAGKGARNRDAEEQGAGCRCVIL